MITLITLRFPHFQYKRLSLKSVLVQNYPKITKQSDNEG